MKTKLVILDLGKVFFEFDASRALAHWGRVAGVDAAVLAGRMGAYEDDARFDCGLIPQDEFFAHLMKRLGVSIPVHELKAGWNSIFTYVIAPAYEAAQQIRGKHKLVALSNTNAAHQPVWEAQFREELKVFDHIYTSLDLKMRKPDRRIFEYVLADQGVSAAETVFFDDLEANVEGARKAGITGIRVTSPFTVAEWLRTAAPQVS